MNQNLLLLSLLVLHVSRLLSFIYNKQAIRFQSGKQLNQSSSAGGSQQLSELLEASRYGDVTQRLAEQLFNLGILD